jgi:hypothetical protein
LKIKENQNRTKTTLFYFFYSYNLFLDEDCSTHICPNGQYCENTNNGPVCKCQNGYEMESRSSNCIGNYLTMIDSSSSAIFHKLFLYFNKQTSTSVDDRTLAHLVHRAKILPVAFHALKAAAQAMYSIVR